MDALQSCPELKKSEEGGDGLVHVCDTFIKESLLPSINRQGKHGWSASHNKTFDQYISFCLHHDRTLPPLECGLVSMPQ
jgi:hypothetical protein